jgi:putative SOS response-associated peptidase YedK
LTSCRVAGRCFAIIITTPNELYTELHNRMPVLKTDGPMWLGGAGRHAAAQIGGDPLPADEMVCWPVSARVGNVRNNDPNLIELIVLR